MKDRSKLFYFICTIIALILFGIHLYRILPQAEAVASASVGAVMPNADIQFLQDEISRLRRESYDSGKKKESACRVVKNFLSQYYESDYQDPIARLSMSSMYLTDAAIAQLYPYENSPNEVTGELILQVRRHDPEIITQETTTNKNTIDSISIYYDETGTYNMEVFSIFKLSTFIGNAAESSSFYLFRCTVINDGSEYYIDDILLKSPAILPAYDPDIMTLGD